MTELPWAFQVVMGLMMTIGLPMDIETLKVLAAWSAPVIAAVLTYFAAKHKLRTDSKTTDMANLVARMDKMQTRLDDVERELREEREKNALERAERRTERDEERSKIRAMEDDIRDRDELIADMADYLVAIEDWQAGGYTPPNPTQTWRVRMHVKAHRKTLPPPTGEHDTVKGG